MRVALFNRFGTLDNNEYTYERALLGLVYTIRTLFLGIEYILDIYLHILFLAYP